MKRACKRGLTGLLLGFCLVAADLCTIAPLYPQSEPVQARGLEPVQSESGAGRRLALVIGNNSYPWKPLKNPENDAVAVAATLGRDGFAPGDLHLATNLKGRDMRVAVREFVESVKPKDFAFVYFSGHGVEVNGTNYLLPVDIPEGASELEVEDDAVSAQKIVRDLKSQGADVTIMVLNACRDNPLRATRSTGGGLAPMEGLGSLVVFATEAGRTASDNAEGRNGLFTTYLLKALAMKGVSLDVAIIDIARQMAAETQRKQIPAIYGLLEKPVYLVSPPAATGVAPVPVATPDVMAWNAIEDSRNPQDYDDFAAAYPQSQYATAAKLTASRLRRDALAASTERAGIPRNETTPVDDSTAINLVIQRYAEGVGSGDLEKIKAVRQFHGNEEKKMVENLQAVKGKGYALRNCSVPQITGDNAQVSCDTVLTSSKETPPGHVTFYLKRIYGQWFILLSN